MEAETKTTLTNLVEDQLTYLLQDAISVQRRTKRVKLRHDNGTTPQSTSASGGVVVNNNNNHLEGGVPVPRIVRSIDVEDINLALRWRGSEILYPSCTTITTESDTNNADNTNTPPTATSRNVDLNAYVRSEMPTRPPSEIGLTVHWLAVDGIQPSLPQNPALGPEIHHVSDSASMSSDTDDEVSTKTTPTASADPTTDVAVRQLLPRLLSEELQLYFTRITAAVERGEDGTQDAALASVARDAGTQELVPFFSRFISNRIFGNVGKAEYCRTLVRLADALISNPHMHLELHLHQILPAIITCVVARSLSSQPDSDHYSLREEASRTLVKACNIFGDQYTTLRSRVLKTLCDAIGPDKPLTTQYGGIVGISLFGPKAIDAFLLPIAPLYFQAWERELGSDKSGGPDQVRRFELRQCQTAILNAVGIFMHHSSLFDKSGDLDVDMFDDVFGEKLIPFQPNQLGYESLLI